MNTKEKDEYFNVNDEETYEKMMEKFLVDLRNALSDNQSEGMPGLNDPNRYDSNIFNYSRREIQDIFTSIHAN